MPDLQASTFMDSMHSPYNTKISCVSLRRTKGRSHGTLSLQKYSVAIEARSRMLELVPPGRVIFLRPLKTKNVRTSWDAVWVKAEEVIREVSSHMQYYPYLLATGSGLLGSTSFVYMQL